MGTELKCPSCGDTFPCGHEGPTCWCRAQRYRVVRPIPEKYGRNCLCPTCLLKYCKPLPPGAKKARKAKPKG